MRKNRLIDALILIFFVIVLFLRCFVPWYSWYKRVIDTDEFRVFEGNWMVTEYLDEAVEYHGGEMDEQTVSAITETLKNKYLGTMISIKPSNITYFCTRTESGYRFLTWDDLFFVYRQPGSLEAEPPFWGADFLLKDNTEYVGIIIDNDEKAFLFVKGSIFRLERVS